MALNNLSSPNNLNLFIKNLSTTSVSSNTASQNFQQWMNPYTFFVSIDGSYAYGGFSNILTYLFVGPQTFTMFGGCDVYSRYIIGKGAQITGYNLLYTVSGVDMTSATTELDLVTFINGSAIPNVSLPLNYNIPLVANGSFSYVSQVSLATPIYPGLNQVLNISFTINIPIGCSFEFYGVMLNFNRSDL